MKYWKLFAILSGFFNLLLLILLLSNRSQSILNKPKDVGTLDENKDYSMAYNFRKIFIERNDSVYKEVFSKSFEDLPEQAFLLSSTYFFLTKDSLVLKDMKVACSQLESIYDSCPEY